MIKVNENLPSISIVIPTYNSERVLKDCLDSIEMQDYPKDLIEVIIADGGSTDRTMEILKDYRIDKIEHNSLVTGEAGKAVGVEAASNEIIALIDSDNVLDGKDWLRRMTQPFDNPEITGTEPLYYTYRKEDTVINRYCALLGMNDPLCLYLGNYDRFSHLTDKWTGLHINTLKKDEYLQLELDGTAVPTIGANGFMVRRKSILDTSYKPYLFDIDVVHQLVQNGMDKFAKVEIGIIHLFAVRVGDFAKKQSRRINDYLYFKKKEMRTYPWQRVNKKGLIKFILATVFIFPLIFDATRGYIKKHDHAWFFHPIACWITLFIYTSGWVIGVFSNSRITK